MTLLTQPQGSRSTPSRVKAALHHLGQGMNSFFVVAFAGATGVIGGAAIAGAISPVILAGSAVMGFIVGLTRAAIGSSLPVFTTTLLSGVAFAAGLGGPMITGASIVAAGLAGVVASIPDYFISKRASHHKTELSDESANRWQNAGTVIATTFALAAGGVGAYKMFQSPQRDDVAAASVQPVSVSLQYENSSDRFNLKAVFKPERSTEKVYNVSRDVMRSIPSAAPVLTLQ